MALWLIYAILTVLGLAVYKTAIRFVSEDSNPIFLMTIVSFFYFLFWLIIFFLNYDKNTGLSLKANDLALVTILSIAFFVSDYFLLKAYMADAKLSIMTILMGVAMVGMVIFGILFFKEKLSIPQIIGIGLGIASFLLLTFFEKQPA